MESHQNDDDGCTVVSTSSLNALVEELHTLRREVAELREHDSRRLSFTLLVKKKAPTGL